jgi:lactate permease
MTNLWTQNSLPFAGSLAWSAAVAAAPIAVVLVLLGLLRRPAWVAAVCALASAFAVAVGVYGMPAGLAVAAMTYGAAFGLFPIVWILFWAVVLYRLTVETGRFEVIRASVGALTSDRRLQALLVAFAFGAFIEGAAGFGTPVAVAAAMLTGLGFAPFEAAAICLLANTAPVAFGSVGIPVITLAAVTGLPLADLSANVGRICAPLSLIVPSWLVVALSGWSGWRGVWREALACGAAFASVQFAVSNYIGPQLTDVLSALAAILVLLLMVRREGAAMPAGVVTAWAPYLALVVLILAWGAEPMKGALGSTASVIAWPGLDGIVQRANGPYPAKYTLNLLASSGTACLLAAVFTAALFRVRPVVFAAVCGRVLRQLALSIVTICCVLALAFLMNYSGMTVTLGRAFAATGAMLPFFSALLGWLGVFLTGSDTSANALFGNLQAVTARELGMNPVLMAASNSAGGVMGKMISLQSIAVAAAATGMAASEEPRLFRFTLRHSIALAVLLACVVVFYAYVMPGWVR